MTRVVRALLLVLLALLLSACQVDADVLVQVRDDGSGTVTVTVTLDPEAAARVPDLGDQLAIDDLEAAGWQVDGPSTVEGGAVQLRATKGFATPEDGAAVLVELTGPDGLLTDVVLERERSFGRTTYSFSATADPSGGVAALADQGLVDALGGDGFGGQLDVIEADTGAPPDDQVGLTVRVQLPGAARTWAIEPGGEPQQLSLRHEERHLLPLGLAAAGVLCFVAGVALLLVRLVGGRRRVPRTSAEPDAVPEPSVPAGAVDANAIPWGDGTAAAAEPVASPPVDEAPAGRRLQLVVLDVMGVVFTTGSRVDALLADFARQRGSTLDDDAVAASWGLAAEGRLTVGELWASLGLTDDPGDLSDEFLALHRLRPGARDFLERMTARDLPVAGVADDIAEWSRKLRTTHKLDHLTRAWIVSGDVGERLPGGAVLGRVIQVTGIEARNALFLSDRVSHLDAARSYGFAGAWFCPDDDVAAATPALTYPRVTSLDDLAP